MPKKSYVLHEDTASLFICLCLFIMVLILVHILLDISEFESILREKFCPSVTAQAKRQAWVKIAQQINASFPLVARIRKECEKRGYVLHSMGRWMGDG